MSKKKCNVILFVCFIIICACILSFFMHEANDHYEEKYTMMINDYYEGYTGEDPPKGEIEDKLSALTSKAFIKGNQANIKKLNKND